MSSDAPDPLWGEPGKQHKKTPTRQGTPLPHAPGPGLSGLVPGRPAHPGQHRAAGSSVSGLAASPRVCRRFQTENSPVLQTAGFLSPAAASVFSLVPAPSVTLLPRGTGRSLSRSVLPRAHERAGNSRRCPRPRSARQGRCPVSPGLAGRPAGAGSSGEAPSHRAVRPGRARLSGLLSEDEKPICL